MDGNRGSWDRNATLIRALAVIFFLVPLAAFLLILVLIETGWLCIGC